MVDPSSLLAFENYTKVMDQALEDELGVRIKFPDEAAAITWRVRAHTARRYDRQRNSEVYAEDHILHGRSAYDELVLKIRSGPDCAYVYIVKRSTEQVEAEPLSKLEFDDTTPPKRIDHTPVVERLTFSQPQLAPPMRR